MCLHYGIRILLYYPRCLSVDVLFIEGDSHTLIAVYHMWIPETLCACSSLMRVRSLFYEYSFRRFSVYGANHMQGWRLGRE